MLKDILKFEKPTTMSFYNNVTSVVNGVITKDSSVLTLSVKGLFWTGATAQRYVNEQLRPDVDGVCAFDYDKYTTTIEPGARLEVDGKDYNVLYVENVGEQDELIIIPVKK